MKQEVVGVKTNGCNDDSMMTAPTASGGASRYNELIWTFANDDDDPAVWHVLPIQTFSHVSSRQCL